MKKASKQQRKLTEEERTMAEQNIKLVHFIVKNTFHVTITSSNYDDMVSIGTMGLIKAVQSFNKEKKIKFSSYATTCIKNEIRMYYRKRKKYLYESHMEDIITEDKDGNKMTLENIIEDPKANFVEEIFKQQETIRDLEMILNCLRPRDTIILLNRIAGKTQKETGEIMGISQSYVSRRRNKIFVEVRKIVNKTIELEKVFQVTRKEDSYQIIFLLERIGNVHGILSRILSEVQSEDLSDLLITHNSNEFTIKMPVNVEGFLMSFSTIAQIYYELYKNYPNFFDETIKHNNKRLKGI
ncbi:MAG: sigma-70 family RNA polymerase sigma factor [Clostridia bacterium]|nr:sigma-70 family RNA polymerase sigma factor [Clostridia bacterium]